MPTAKELAVRGYRTICLGRDYDYQHGLRRPPRYKVVELGAPPESRWEGMIEGVPSQRGIERAQRYWHRKLSPNHFRAYPRLKSGGVARRPLPEKFHSVPDAAHAIIDHNRTLEGK